MSNEMKAGYQNDDMAHYLSDPTPEPSLSTRVVCNLIDRSPMHAHWEHVRLGKHSAETPPRADLGSAIHTAILGGAEIAYIEANDWRTNAAKEARDNAHAEGKIPLLAKQQAAVQRAAESGSRLLASLGKGRAELSVYFQIDGCWARGRADWLTDDGRYDVDVKTVDSADPYLFARKQLHQSGYDIQMALRGLGHEAIKAQSLSERPMREGLFLLVEIEPPYAASLVGLGPTARELAERKVHHAARVWRKCLDDQKWPGYGDKVVWAESASFAAFDAEERGIP
jgi:hypothetical protein